MKEFVPPSPKGILEFFYEWNFECLVKPSRYEWKVCWTMGLKVAFRLCRIHSWITRRTIENKEDPAKLALSPSEGGTMDERKLCLTNPHARLVSTEWHRTNIHSKTDLETTTREEKKNDFKNVIWIIPFLLIGVP